MAKNEKIVIIGASHAGVQLAVSLRENGFSGTITIISEEQPTPYHRPPLSKAFLKDVDHQVQILRADDYYQNNDIELIKPRRVVSIDLDNEAVQLDDGKSLDYSSVVLATGARPRVLDLRGIDAKGIFQLRNACDAKALRDGAQNYKKAVVVGGGFIGLEAASTLHALGLDVSVVEAAPRLMGRAVAPEISQYVLERYRALGIKVYLDTPITALNVNKGKVTGIVCNEQQFDADMVLFGIGVIANDELASVAGLETSNGIHVDQNLQTSAKNIYAIGDVAAYKHPMVGERIRVESVQNATDQARNLANTLTGKKEPFSAVPWFWSEQADMKLQMVGLSHRSHSRITRENKERGSFTAFHFDKADKLIAIDTINSPADHMAGRKLMEKGISVSPQQAGDENITLKSLLK